MARSVFYSFHYDADNWRVQQIKNIGRLESEPLLNGNQWEEVWKGGEQAVKRWIDKQMDKKTCLVVLVGAETANRHWIRYEVVKAWNDGKGVLGIRVDRLLDRSSKPSSPGPNPFGRITYGQAGTLSDIAPLKIPNGLKSKAVYADISANIETWVEEAIAIRKAR